MEELKSSRNYHFLVPGYICIYLLQLLNSCNF
jgi:hypothetical protein